MVGDALHEGETLPEYPAGGGGRVELQNLRTDKEMIVLPGELPADVNRLVLQDGTILFHSQRSQSRIPYLVRKNSREFRTTRTTHVPKLTVNIVR